MRTWSAAVRRLIRSAIVLGVLGIAGSAVAQDTASVSDATPDISGAHMAAAQERAQPEPATWEHSRWLVAGFDEKKLKPYLGSADGTYRLELGGRIQLDYQTGEADERLLTGQEITGRFFVRRARLDVSGELSRWVGFKVEGEFTDTPSLTDGYVDLKPFRELELRGGQFKVPFSLEELTSSRFIDFVERSMVNDLAPARDQGFALSGQLFDRVLAYSIGLFNGSGQHTPDTNNERSFAGRLVVTPFRNTENTWLNGLQIAANGTVGDGGEGSSAQGRTTARTSDRFEFFAPQPASGNRYRWGADLMWLVGPGSLKFEYDQQIDQRKGLGPNGSDLAAVIATGWYVTGTLVLTGEDSVLNGPVAPKRPFTPFIGTLGPGAWELAARYSQLKFRSGDPVDFFDGDIDNGITGGGRTAENGASSVTVGANWYLNSRTRTMVNWSQYWYDNELGTPFSCDRSTCGYADLARGGDSNWEIQTRVQFWF